MSATILLSYSICLRLRERWWQGRQSTGYKIQIISYWFTSLILPELTQPLGIFFFSAACASLVTSRIFKASSKVVQWVARTARRPDPASRVSFDALNLDRYLRTHPLVWKFRKLKPEVWNPHEKIQYAFSPRLGRF